jgi:hypothetical protein
MTLALSLLYCVHVSQLTQELSGVLVVASGMLVAASLSAAAQYLRRTSSDHETITPFDLEWLRGHLMAPGSAHASLTSSSGAEGESAVEEEPRVVLPRLRLELEREIVRLAGETASHDHEGLSALVDRLAQGSVLNVARRNALLSILYVCNAVVHGEDLPEEIVRNTVSVGNDLLAYLHARNPETSMTFRRTESEQALQSTGPSKSAGR